MHAQAVAAAAQHKQTLTPHTELFLCCPVMVLPQHYPAPCLLSSMPHIVQHAHDTAHNAALKKTQAEVLLLLRSLRVATSFGDDGVQNDSTALLFAHIQSENGKLTTEAVAQKRSKLDNSNNRVRETIFSKASLPANSPFQTAGAL